MAYIRIIDDDEAGDDLRREYDAARRRTGKVFNVLRIQSLHPAALRQGVSLYETLMHGPSPLSRAEREMLAVVVSRANDCHY